MTYFLRILLIILSCYSYGQSSEVCRPQLIDNRTSASEPYAKLKNFRIENDHDNQVFFDATADISGLSTTGFSISGEAVSTITINPDKLGGFITTSSSFDFWDNNTIRLEGGNGIVADFTLQYITNKIDEPSTSISKYVSANAMGGGEGSKVDPWTLAEAFNKATAGTTVWIKSGNYGDTQHNVAHSGTASEPIRFIGYKSADGDISSNYFTYSPHSSLNDSEMPTLVGDGSGTALSITGDYLIFKNIQIENFERNFYMPSSLTGVIFENCIGHGTPQIGYSGYNYRNNHDQPVTNVRISDCIAVNAGIENFHLIGNHNLIINCQSYADLRESTDYFYAIRGNHNILINSHALRAEDNEHSGHGLSVKGESVPTEYNLIENCIVKNIYMAIEARHDEVKYNVYRNISCTRDDGMPKTKAGGIWLQNGPSNNLFDGILVNDCRVGISMISTTEDLTAEFGAANNTIINSVFSNNTVGLSLRRDNSDQKRFESNNNIINCTFFGSDYLLDQESTTPGENNTIINSIISDTKIKENNSTNTFGWTYEYSAFYNNHSLTAPRSNGNVFLNPYYKNPDSLDFHLTERTPIKIKKGAQIRSEVQFDMDGSKRNYPYSMGAYQQAELTK